MADEPEVTQPTNGLTTTTRLSGDSADPPRRTPIPVTGVEALRLAAGGASMLAVGAAIEQTIRANRAEKARLAERAGDGAAPPSTEPPTPDAGADHDEIVDLRTDPTDLTD